MRIKFFPLQSIQQIWKQSRRPNSLQSLYNTGLNRTKADKLSWSETCTCIGLVPECRSSIYCIELHRFHVRANCLLNKRGVARLIVVWHRWVTTVSLAWHIYVGRLVGTYLTNELKMPFANIMKFFLRKHQFLWKVFQ